MATGGYISRETKSIGHFLKQKSITQGRISYFSNILADRQFSAGCYLGLFTVSNSDLYDGRHAPCMAFSNLSFTV